MLLVRANALAEKKTHHDNSEWHGKSGDAPEEGSGADESERPGVDPLPKELRGHASVQVHQRYTYDAPVHSTYKPATQKKSTCSGDDSLQRIQLPESCL